MDELVWTGSYLKELIDQLESLIVEAELAESAPISSFDLMVRQWNNNALMGDFWAGLPSNYDIELRPTGKGPFGVYLDGHLDYCSSKHYTCYCSGNIYYSSYACIMEIENQSFSTTWGSDSGVYCSVPNLWRNPIIFTWTNRSWTSSSMYRRPFLLVR